MNYFMQVLIIIWLCFLFPLCMGALVEKLSGKKFIRMAELVVTGWMGVLAFFLVLTIWAITAELPLSMLAEIWMMIAGVITVIGIIAGRKSLVEKGKALGQSVIHSDMLSKVVYVLIIFMILLAVFFVKPDELGDIPEITVRAIATDSLYGYDAYTGTSMYAVPGQFKYAPFDMFYAVLGSITGIHGTLLIKTIMPVVWIPVIYAEYMLWGMMLFGKDAKKENMFLVAMTFLNCYPLFVDRGMGFRVVAGAWQRDTLLYSLVLPMALWLCMMFAGGKKKLREVFLPLILSLAAAELLFYKGFYFVLVLIVITVGICIVRRCCKWQKS